MQRGTGNNPLYPPYFKGDGEEDNPYFKDSPLKIRGARGVMKEAPMKSWQLQESGEGEGFIQNHAEAYNLTTQPDNKYNPLQ
jgi:hypothetical protein